MEMVWTRLALCPCLVVAWVVAQPTVLRAQAQKYVGKEIVNIQFVPADQPLDPEELFRILPLKRGQTFLLADVDASIARLFATGRYTDIQVDAEPFNNGVIVRFITRNNWFIGNVQAEGAISEPPTSGQLESASRLDLGQAYTDAGVQQALATQHQLLVDNGLYMSQIHPAFTYDSEYQQVNIRFDVTSGPRARLTTPVLHGDLKMEPDRIIAATHWRRSFPWRWIGDNWKPVTQERVRRGLDRVRNLYDKDNRLEAKVSLESMRYDPESESAVPTVDIDAGPRITVEAVGAKISQKTFRQYVPIYEEHAIDNDLLTEGARNLRDYFQRGGYFDSQVEFKRQRVINDRATIDYLINTGPRHKLVRLEIAGNHYFSTDTLRERMFLQTSSLLQFRHGRYSENLLAEDEQTIADLYRSNGFRDVRVTHRVVDNYQGKDSDLAVFISIEEGHQYFVNSLQVDGIQQLKREQVLATLSSVPGQPFSEFNVGVDRDTILGRYFENGFPNATFSWSSQPARQPYRVDLHFMITEGEQQSVRQVLVSGLHVTRPQLVDRNLHLNPGDPLSPTAMSDTQRRLYDLGIFSRVDTAIQDPDGETSEKYVLYQIDEAHRYSMAVGVGAELGRLGGCQACLDAPQGATGFSPEVSFNISRNNLWGIGHTVSLQTRISAFERQGVLNYTWPRFGGDDNLTVSVNGLYEDSRDVRTFSAKREETSAQLSQRLSKATTLLYRYTFRRVSVDQGTLKISPLLIPLLAQPVHLGEVSFGLVNDRRDDPINPRKGMYTTLDLSLAERVMGSQRNFLRFLAHNSSYYAIGRRFVIARSTELGDIDAFNYAGNPEDAIPLPERFFAGGGTSDRGFPDFQAGPRDPTTGFPVGGTALFFNQTEFRFPLIGDNIGGVLFHDFGNTFSSLNEFSVRVHQHGLQDFNYMVHAAGFGVRYRTPIGPLRLDLAYSINPPNFIGFKGSEQDLVSAGVNPCAAAPAKCVEQSVSHFQFFFSIGQTF